MDRAGGNTLSFPSSIYRRMPKSLPKELHFSRYSLEFDGVNDRVRTSLTFDPASGDWTVILWVRLRTLASVKGAIECFYGGPKADGGQARSTLYQHFTNDHYASYLGGANRDSGYTLQTGVWYCLGATWDNTAGELRLYVNGEQEGPTFSFAIEAASGVHVIGSHPGETSQFMDGWINEVQFIARLLTDHEMREYFRRSCARLDSDSRMLLRMEEGSGLTTYDDSGLGNNGSLLPADDPPTWRRNRMWALRAESGL